MNWFLDSIDLSANIERGLAAIRGMRGLGALILAVALTLVCIALAPLIWYFDLDATLYATEIAQQVVLPSLPGEWAQAAGWLALGLTILPTLVELFGSKFAQVGIRVAAALVYLFSVFDAVTDWPRVEEFCNAYARYFDGLGLFAGPAFFAFRALFLFLATFGFEVVFVVFAVCALALYANSGRGRGKTGTAAASAE